VVIDRSNVRKLLAYNNSFSVDGSINVVNMLLYTKIVANVLMSLVEKYLKESKYVYIPSYYVLMLNQVSENEG